jgi:hypothetical protein
MRKLSIQQERKTEPYTCILCKTKFKRIKKHGVNKIPLGVRREGCITCSTKCSRDYANNSTLRVKLKEAQRK